MLAALLTFLEFEKSPDTFALQEVTMVGFLIQNDQQQWYLSREPNIRSCCIGKKKEIRLPADFPPALRNTVVKVQGVLHTQNGYSLQNPTLIKKD